MGPSTKKWVADLLKGVETKGKRASRENDDEFSDLLSLQQVPARGSTEYDDEPYAPTLKQYKI